MNQDYQSHRARIEALEAAQLEQAESNRFCTDAIVRRVEALEAAHVATADVSRLSDAEREQVTQELAKPAAWRPLKIETTYGSEAATATAQQILRAPVVVEGTFEHGGETCRFKAKPERVDAMTELRAASAEVRPAGGLVERVAQGIAAADDEGLTNMTWNYHARAAIREVAAWLTENYAKDVASPPPGQMLRDEARPAKGLVLRVSEANNSRDAIRAVAAWLRTGRLLHAAELLEQEADRG
jgi:hypothetical protein